jgi:hypothetical protein
VPPAASVAPWLNGVGHHGVHAVALDRVNERTERHLSALGVTHRQMVGVFHEQRRVLVGDAASTMWRPVVMQI